MDTFSPGDKVIKRTETDSKNYGEVMDEPNRPMYRKDGYIAVYFRRQVWIKPENLMHYAEWQKKHQPSAPTGNIKDYWINNK